MTENDTALSWATTRYSVPIEYEQKISDLMDSFSPEQRDHLTTWLEIGNQNQWILEANDPPFDALCFHMCQDASELHEKIMPGNYSLGQAFVLDDLCFINQINGGDEWLTIKGKTPFESITMQTFDETMEEATDRFYETIKRIQRATEEQCKNLEY